MSGSKVNPLQNSKKLEVNKPCLACGSTQSEPVFEKQYPENGYPGFFAMRRCEICGLWFNSPRLEDRFIPYLYDEKYYFFNRSVQREYRRILDLYKRSVFLVKDRVQSKKVLEVGSAKGYLLALLKNLGWAVQGIEISPEASRYARQKFDVHTFTGTVEQYRLKKNHDSFPLVLAIDVIEHIPQPERFMCELNTIVRKEGWVIIDTPNGDAKEILRKSAEWIGFNPYHIFIFSESNLSMILEKSGFKVKAVHYYNHIPYPSNSDSNADTEVLKAKIKKAIQAAGLLPHAKKIYEYLYRMVENLHGNANLLQDTVRKVKEFESSDVGAADIFDSPNRGSNNMLILAKKI